MESSGCQGEKGRTFRNSKNLFGPQLCNIFYFLIVRRFSTRGFFKFLFVLAHGVALHSGRKGDKNG